MRFVELILFATPFLAFVAWRVLAPDRGPPRALVFGVAGGMLLLLGLLLVLWREDAEPPGAGYEPTRIENGHVVPGRVLPR